MPNRLFFYGSYYRPEVARSNASNFYGELPGYESTRNEGFGKLTSSPTNSTLFNFSYRYSHRLDKGVDVRPDHGAHRGHRRRSVAEDPHGRRLVGHQPPRAS